MHPRGPIWDIGAGLGGVAVDLARAFPGSEVVAFERSEVQRAYLRENRLRFAAYNLRVVAGEAPECLVGEGRPSAIFLGGSGGRLGAILDLAFDRLAGGRAAGGELHRAGEPGPVLATGSGARAGRSRSPRSRSGKVGRSPGSPRWPRSDPVWVVRTSRPEARAG